MWLIETITSKFYVTKQRQELTNAKKFKHYITQCMCTHISDFLGLVCSLNLRASVPFESFREEERRTLTKSFHLASTQVIRK